ncbi:unnamed protein product, partial [Symbiodinium necroappetens]
RRVVVRALAVLLLVGGLALVGGWLYLTRSGTVRGMVMSRVESALACEATCSSVSISLGGRVVVRDLILRVPGMDGRAGEFLLAERAVADVDLGVAATGASDAVRSIELVGAMIRLSQSEDLRLNIEGLGSSGAGAMVRVPAVRVREGRLELGEHEGASYSPLTDLTVTGLLDSDPDDPSVLRFELAEGDGEASGALTLAGSFDLETLDGEARLTNVDLERWGEAPAPRRFRDVWADLGLAGSVDEARLSYGEDSGLSVVISLREVDLDLPITGRIGAALEGAAAEAIDLRRVAGDLRFERGGFGADLQGLIAELPVRVSFESQGYAPDSPFVARIVSTGFKFEERPSLLPFAPRNIRELFERFSSPSAEVDGSVSVARLPDGRLAVSGAFSLRDGFVLYDAFPYPIGGVSAQVEFDDESVRIVNVAGTGPTGATFSASGAIAPLGTDAALALEVGLYGVPLDEHFRDALPESVFDVFGSVAHAPSYAELVSRGLVMGSDLDAELEVERVGLEVEIARGERRGDEEADLAELRIRLAEVLELERVPVYDLGGTVDFEATIEQTFGRSPALSGDITGTVRNVAMLPRLFPYPLVVPEMKIVVRDWTAFIEPSAFVGLTGARGTLSAEIPDLNEAERDALSSVEVMIDVAPADEFLLHALPGPREGVGPLEDGSAEGVARRLGLGGVGRDVRVSIGERGSSGVHGVDVVLPLDGGGVTLSPPGSGMVVSTSRGSLRVTESSLTLRIEEGELDGSPLRAEIDTTYGAGRPVDVVGRIDLPGLDLSTEVEGFFETIVPGAVASAREARARYAPSGVADVGVLIGTGPGDPGDPGGPGGSSGVSFGNGRDIELTAFGGRVGLATLGGEVFTNGSRTVFSGVEGAALTYGGEPVGRLSAEGVFSAGGAARPGDSLSLSVLDARVESGAIRNAVRERSPRLAEWLDTHGARGTFDIGVEQRPGEAGLHGWFNPEVFEIVRRGERMRIEFTGGEIAFDERGGTIDSVVAGMESWTLDLNGGWSTEGEGSVRIDVGARGETLSAPVLAALPAPVAKTLASLELDVGEDFEMRDASFEVERAFGGGTPRTEFAGTLLFTDASLRAGVVIEKIDGTAAMTIYDDGSSALPDLDIAIDAASLELAGVGLSSGRVRIVTGMDEGVLAIPSLRLYGHGGLVTGYAEVRFADEYGVELVRKPVRMRFDASGLAFSSFYEDLLSELDVAPSLRGLSEAETGVLDASLSIETVLGDTGATEGRGLVRVRSGNIVEMPGVLPLLELSNLQAPFGERLEIGYADFFVLGDRLVFDVLEATSPSLLITGEGGVRYTTGEIDLAFRTRGGRAIPIVSTVLEGVRDEFFTARVRGTLAEPAWTMEQLPATRRFLTTIFEGEPVGNGRITMNRVTETPTGAAPRRPERAVDLPAFQEKVRELVIECGADPANADSEIITDLVLNALKLVTDGRDRGELKLLRSSFKEMRYAYNVFERYTDVPKISIFGSARTKPDHPDYKAAVEFSKEMADRGWLSITGAGDGIMRAGHEGPGRESSFGLAIRLPFETTANDIILGDDKLIHFRYFFTRKLMFVSQSSAVAVFPGGFGTQDEIFEALTLIQTGKSAMVPVVLVEGENGSYWKHWMNYIEKSLLGGGFISPEDMDLFHIAKSTEEAAAYVCEFFRNYHSSRYVGDDYVIRLKKPLTDKAVGELNEEFEVLIREGQIVQREAYPIEDEFMDLPRLAFTHTRHHIGLLRRLIDRVNDEANIAK